MKLHFEPDLDYQLDAIAAVRDLFKGQEHGRTEFTVSRPREQQLEQFTSHGVGNRLLLLDEEILANLKAIQLRQGLRPDDALASMNFSVEMETGTGKTYVYLRTIFELHKTYGFSKFVIVVPSVAIKEGVRKSIEITAEHLRSLYEGVPFGHFVYDSARLGEVRNFATSAHIQIMVVTVQALTRKDHAVVYQERDQLSGEKPIDLIRATSPMVIIDEPQSVEGGDEGQGAKAIREMNPLCVLRYSATHRNPHHMVYQLDAVAAYQRKLVKQIEVAAGTVEAGFNKPFVRLVKVSAKKGVVTAQVELDVAGALSVSRKAITVRDGDDLREVTGHRDVYQGMRIGELQAGKGRERMELRRPGGEEWLHPGEAFGDVDSTSLQREMIRRTIREHFEKERRLRSKGIKVLSLFFIEQVAKYREYAEDGSPVKGEYARIFEDEFARLARHPDFNDLFTGVDTSTAAAEVHGGYFAADRKKVGGRSVELFKDSTGKSAADDDAYNLIMRDKERLLSFDTPLRFIFSHSALREGWDNPNVFQICSLRDMRSERERRQTLGRGLRLCVNQEGQRLHGFDVNTLTVIASESYEEFADQLQREIEAETGIRFGIVPDHAFTGLRALGTDGSEGILGYERSKELWSALHQLGYIDGGGRVTDVLRSALRTGAAHLPDAFAAQHEQIEDILRKHAGRLEIRNADERRTVRARRAVLDDPEFQRLWDAVKFKTTYRLHFDNEKLIGECVDALRAAPPVSQTRLMWRTAQIRIDVGGVDATETGSSAPVMLRESDIELPDILTVLQDRTQLTRRTICRILIESGRLDDFKRNPQQFIDVASNAINHRKRLALVDGVRYQRLGDTEYYAQELFLEQELTGYVRNMLETAPKSVLESVIYDSEPERQFADAMERSSAVKVYAKLPGWFTVPTPLGAYNPDWAVLVTTDDGDKLYFVAETKHTASLDQLFDTERSKIECAKRHYEVLRDHAKAVRAPEPRYWAGASLDEMIASGAEGSES